MVLQGSFFNLSIHSTAAIRLVPSGTIPGLIDAL